MRSWKDRLPLVLGIAGIGLFALGFILPLWGAVRSIHAAWQFRPYAEPYQARVVGFETRYGRHASTAPIVEVQQADGSTFKFTSSHYSVIQTFVNREPVKLVVRPGTNLLGAPSEQLEIDNAYHLWIADVLIALLLPTLLLGVWWWGKFFPAPLRRGSYTLPS